MIYAQKDVGYLNTTNNALTAEVYLSLLNNDSAQKYLYDEKLGLMDSLKQFAHQHNWIQGEFLYYYLYFKFSFEKKTNTDSIGNRFKELYDRYETLDGFDSLSHLIVSRCVVMGIQYLEYYWAQKLAQIQYEKLQHATTIGTENRLKALYNIVATYGLLQYSNKLPYYIQEIKNVKVDGSILGLNGFKYDLLSMAYSILNSPTEENLYQDSALFFYEKSTKAPLLKYHFYNAKIENYLKEKKLDSAFLYLNKNRILDIEVKDFDIKKVKEYVYRFSEQQYMPYMFADHYLDNLAHYFIQKGQYDNAKTILLTLFEKRIDKKDYNFVIHILPLLQNAYSGNKQLDSALYFANLYNHLSDSINISQRRQLYQNIIIELQSDINQKDLILHYKDQSLQYKNTIIWGAIILSVIIIILLITFIRFYRLKIRFQTQKITTIQERQEKQELGAKIKGQEEEKKRLATELHDNIANQVWALNLNVDKIKTHITDNLVALNYLNKLKKEIDLVFEDVLGTARNLKPNLLVNDGIALAIRALCERINNQYERKVIQWKICTPVPRYAIEAELSVFRIVQELIFNSLKHANASHIYVQISCVDDCLNLTVEDNGVGFSGNSSSNEKLGLQNIHERVKLLSGEIEFMSTPNQGTSIYIEFENLPKVLAI